MTPEANLKRVLRRSMEINGDAMPDQTVRTLTDADVSAIVEGLQDRFMKDLYANIGKGVWALVQKAFITAMVAVAAYGFYRSK